MAKAPPLGIHEGVQAPLEVEGVLLSVRAASVAALALTIYALLLPPLRSLLTAPGHHLLTTFLELL